MQTKVLLEILQQNRFNSSVTFKEINTKNVNFRLNEKTASAGFIYRHIGETINTLGQYLGFETNVEDTTMGKTDTGKKYDTETSAKLIEQGYNKLKNVIKNSSDKDWLEEIETPLFGKISKIRLLSIILFHISHHCGQIASAIVKGKTSD